MSDTIILTPELDEVIAPQSGITGMARRAAASTRPFLGNRSFRRMRQFEPDHSIVCVQFIGDFPALFFFFWSVCTERSPATGRRGTAFIRRRAASTVPDSWLRRFRDYQSASSHFPQTSSITQEQGDAKQGILGTFVYAKSPLSATIIFEGTNYGIYSNF